MLASGEMSLSRPHHPNQDCTPRPLPSSTSAPTSSTPGAGSSLRLRGTTQDRPAGRPPRPHPLGHARKALGPRVRPRHPPGGPRESTARVSPGPAQRSRPPRLSRLQRPRPRRAFQAYTRTGRGTWDHPASSRGPWACYLDVRGAQTLSAPACGRGARDLRLDCRADPPLGRRLAAADPGASRLRVRRRGSRPPGGGRLLRTRLLAEPAARGWETGPRATHPRRKQGGEPHRSQSLIPFSFSLLLQRGLAALGGDRTGGCTAGDPVRHCRARGAPRGAAPGGARGGAAGISALSLRWGEGEGATKPRPRGQPGTRRPMGSRVGWSLATAA